MNCPALGLRVASVLFGLKGLVVLIFICEKTPVQIGSCVIHRRWMAVSAIILAALCVWLWKLACKASCSKVESPPAKPAA